MNSNVTAEIEDREHYVSEMRKSVLDKMFFLDKIPNKSLIIDWGCADGIFLEHAMDITPGYQYTGYDIDGAMINRALDRLKSKEVFLTDELEALENYLEYFKKYKKVINLSSIIHEVYSYSGANEITAFWKKIFEIGDYVVIRDMIPSSSISRPASDENIRKIYKKAKKEKLERFIERQGDITNNKNLVHYLLKYRYEPNWEREVRENYFPFSLEEFYQIIPDEFEILYKNHYILPFIRETIEKDFGITLVDNTHLQLILKKKGEK